MDKIMTPSNMKKPAEQAITARLPLFDLKLSEKALLIQKQLHNLINFHCIGQWTIADPEPGFQIIDTS